MSSIEKRKADTADLIDDRGGEVFTDYCILYTIVEPFTTIYVLGNVRTRSLVMICSYKNRLPAVLV